MIIRHLISNFLEWISRTIFNDNQTATITIEVKRQTQSFPPDTRGGFWLIYLQKGDSFRYLYQGPNSYTSFTNVYPGRYNVYGVRLDINGEELGEVVSSEIRIESVDDTTVIKIN